jgi:EpsD family peptidyl-prolyl cis-trans isomerase
MEIRRLNLIGAFRAVTIFGSLGLLLLGCSKKIEEKTEASNSQIVARLGDEVVTTQELDNEFRLEHIPTEKRKDPAAIKQALGEIVTRKYLVRQALDSKLDREPTVLLDMLRARELVLANAAASRMISTKSAAIGKAEVDDYIAKNPLKFADHQVVSIEQIAVPASAVSQSMIDSIKDLKTLDEVDQKLTSLGVAHNRSMGALSSGDVSPDFFNLIVAKQADNVFFLRGNPNAVFFKVNGIENRPVAGDDAVKIARQGLQVDLIKSEASLTSVEARLATKYEGDYANIMGAQDNSSQTGAPK